MSPYRHGDATLFDCSVTAGVLFSVQNSRVYRVLRLLPERTASTFTLHHRGLMQPVVHTVVFDVVEGVVAWKAEWEQDTSVTSLICDRSTHFLRPATLLAVQVYELAKQSHQILCILVSHAFKKSITQIAD